MTNAANTYHPSDRYFHASQKLARTLVGLSDDRFTAAQLFDDAKEVDKQRHATELASLL